MALGYILTYNDILSYYLERDDIRRVLLAHGSRRRTVAGTDTGVFGRRGSPLSTEGQIEEMIKPLMEKHLSAVPRKYPAFHACVHRMARNGAGAKRGERSGDGPGWGGGAGWGGGSGAAVQESEAVGAGVHPGRNDEAGTDFVIDIDIKTDHQAAFAQGRKVLDLLESFEVPYRVKFSGNASPHIILSGDLFPPEVAGERFHSVAQRLMDFITRKSHATNVDGSFTSPDHYLRMPYSLNENTGLVSIPIRPEEYNDFRLEWAEAQNVVVRGDWLDVTGERLDGMGALLTAASAFRR